ncbi:unnamed protein product [Closterium sp. Naga37s-1]|nr:unnamed protein product [Closterium sp. Naga37s-1]
MAGCVLQAARRGPSHPRLLVAFVSVLAVLSAARIGRHAWGHVGHAFTCAIAQAAAAVAALLPPTARGSLPAVCVPYGLIIPHLSHLWLAHPRTPIAHPGSSDQRGSSSSEGAASPRR